MDAICDRSDLLIGEHLARDFRMTFRNTIHKTAQSQSKVCHVQLFAIEQIVLLQ